MFGTFIAILFSILALIGIGMLAYVVYVRQEQLSRDTRAALAHKTIHIQAEIDRMKKKINTQRIKLNHEASLSTVAPSKEKLTPPTPLKESFVSKDEPASPWVYLTNSTGSDYLSGGLAAASTWLRDSLLIEDKGLFCMGSTCIDTVAFGQIVTSSGAAYSTMVESIATNVVSVNNGLPPSSSQSVLSLTFAGGQYATLMTSPVVNASTNFTATAVNALKQHLAALGYSGVTIQVVNIASGSIVMSFLITYPSGLSALAGTSAILASLNSSSSVAGPISVALVGTYGITSVSGTDITPFIVSHVNAVSSFSSSGSSRPPSSSSSGPSTSSMPSSSSGPSNSSLPSSSSSSGQSSSYQPPSSSSSSGQSSSYQPTSSSSSSGQSSSYQPPSSSSSSGPSNSSLPSSSSSSGQSSSSLPSSSSSSEGYSGSSKGSSTASSSTLLQPFINHSTYSQTTDVNMLGIKYNSTSAQVSAMLAQVNKIISLSQSESCILVRQDMQYIIDQASIASEMLSCTEVARNVKSSIESNAMIGDTVKIEIIKLIDMLIQDACEADGKVNTEKLKALMTDFINAFCAQ